MSTGDSDLTRRAPLITTIHNTRRVRSYVVFENELTLISMLNGGATLFFSLAATCAGMAFGLWSSLLIESSPSEKATVAVPPLTWLLVIATAVFAIVGTVCVLQRTSEVYRIKKESGDNVQPWHRFITSWFGRTKLQA